MNKELLIQALIKKAIKIAVDVGTLDPKIGNRIKQVKIIYQQIKEVEDTIKKQVGDLQLQIKALEKQAGIFEKELLPVLRELEDHAITAEGIYIQLKAGRRSPKVGYEYLAERVNSELMKAAEEAMTKAAEFAQSPTITVTGSIKKAGIGDWIKSKLNSLMSWVSSLKTKSTSIDKMLEDLDNETSN